MENRDKNLLAIMGLKFKKARLQSGLTQEEISRAISLSRVSIINIENGRQGLSPSNLIKLSTVFNCSILDFFPTDEEYFIEIKSYKISEQEKRELKIKDLEKKIEALKLT